MNENVGASFGLSLLTVLFFAVALHQPEGGPPAPGAVETRTAEPAPALPAAPEPAIAAEPMPAPSVSALAPAPQPRSDAHAVRTAGGGTVPEPRSAFTTVRAGETLADVAARVYGDKGEAARLWRSNRDLLDDEAVPPTPGALLRTP